MLAIDTENEKDCIDRSLRGDPDAFAALVVKYQRMIQALTYRMTGSLVDSEDLAQETFVQAHQQLDKFRFEARFSSWLYRIAVNLCLNWRQRSQRREKIHLEWHESTEKDAAQPDETQAEAVREALLRLPAKQRAAVVLTIYDGLSHSEAARVLECSEATISWRVFAARRKLKSLLKNLNTGGNL